MRWGAEFLLWYAEEIRRPWGEILAANGPSQRLYVRRRPRGVVACITPWNFPSSMITRKLAPARRGRQHGRAQARRADPAVGRAAVRDLRRGRLPARRGQPRVRRPGADRRGLHAARRRSASSPSRARWRSGGCSPRRCAETGKHATLELGGHAPFVVFADADLDLAAEKLTFSKLQNAGPDLHRRQPRAGGAPRAGRARRAPRRAGARRAGRRRARAGRDGRPADRRRRRAPRSRAHVQDALARGARALCGGGPVDGLDPDALLRADGARRRAARRPDRDRGDVRPRRAAHPVRHRGGGGRARQRVGVRPRRLPLHARPRPRAPRRRGARLRHGRRSTTARSAGCRRRSAGSRARATRARAAGWGSRTTSTCST